MLVHGLHRAAGDVLPHEAVAAAFDSHLLYAALLIVQRLHFARTQKEGA